MPPVDVMSPVPDPRNQQPLDMDFAVLIVPDAIPIPGTSVEILQAAVSAMRTAAGEVAEGGEGIESTWQGLQPHYTAPESETLFAAMGPVAAKGGTILDDVTTVASALDTFADAAQTAKTTLNALKDEATTFAEEMRGKDDWSSNPLDYSENRRLKLQVNGIWATFQEAERTCANAISAVSGSGNSYVAASGEAPGTGEIVYGLDPDDVPDVAYDLTSLTDWQRAMEDTWHQLEYSEKPWPADWATDAFMAQWDNFGPGMLWDVGVGAVAWTGLWREGSGWANSVGEATDNFFTNKRETIEGLGSLTGLYGEDGWMNPFDSGERSGETWRANAGAAWTEVAHDIVPWREWEDRPAYTVYTGAGNAALAVVSLPARGGTILANLSRGGSGLPDLDPVDRPEVVWEPGAAARPGFSLSQTFSDISGDFSDTAEGFGAGFGDLSAMIDRFSAGGGVPGGGGGSDLPVFVPEPGAPGAGRPVTAPVAGESSGDPDRPRRGGEDRPSEAPNSLDAPSAERWPEMEEFLDSGHRRGDEGQPVADRDSETSGADTSRPLDATADEGSGAAPNDRLFASLGLDAGEIEREYERDVERTTRQVVDTVEEFRALPAERQLEWLRVNQLVGANVGGPQNSGFGGFGNEDFGITASHDPNSGNGGGPPRTSQDGTSNTGFISGGDSDTSRGDIAASPPLPVRAGGSGGNRTTVSSGTLSSQGKTPRGSDPRGDQNAGKGPKGSPSSPGHGKIHIVPDPERPELTPGPKERFGEKGGLDANSTYKVQRGDGNHVTLYRTDSNGDICEVRAGSDKKESEHPEFLSPRPNATYVVNNRYTYRTDGNADTVVAEGRLDKGKHARNDTQQRVVNQRGHDYYKALNEQLKKQGKNYYYEDGQWNGGHYIGANEFNGTGEQLNQTAMLQVVNQRRNRMGHHGIEGSYRNIEMTWEALQEVDIRESRKKLLKIEKRNDKKAKWEERVDQWLEIVKKGPSPVEIDVNIVGVPDPGLKPIEISEDGVTRTLYPPPGEIVVDWSINGVKQKRFSYPNVPRKIYPKGSK